MKNSLEELRGDSANFLDSTCPEKGSSASKQQLGVRIDTALVVEAKVLAARQQCRLNELIEEALRDLLKKYLGKKGLLAKGKS